MYVSSSLSWGTPTRDPTSTLTWIPTPPRRGPPTWPGALSLKAESACSCFLASWLRVFVTELRRAGNNRCILLVRWELRTENLRYLDGVLGTYIRFRKWVLWWCWISMNFTPDFVRFNLLALMMRTGRYMISSGLCLLIFMEKMDHFIVQNVIFSGTIFKNGASEWSSSRKMTCPARAMNRLSQCSWMLSLCVAWLGCLVYNQSLSLSPQPPPHTRNNTHVGVVLFLASLTG